MVVINAGGGWRKWENWRMSDPKNLLVVKLPAGLGLEQAEQIRKMAEQAGESLGLEMLCVEDPMDATVHPSAQVVQRMDRLCDAIERQCDLVGQLVEYMVLANQEPDEDTPGASLDG